MRFFNGDPEKFFLGLFLIFGNPYIYIVNRTSDTFLGTWNVLIYYIIGYNITVSLPNVKIGLIYKQTWKKVLDLQTIFNEPLYE